MKKTSMLAFAFIAVVAAAEPVAAWRFDGSDRFPVVCKGGGSVKNGALILPSENGRAAATVDAALPDVASDSRAFTVSMRIKAAKGVIPSSVEAMASLCGSRRVTKTMGALKDGAWHRFCITFDPAKNGGEYVAYLDWGDAKSKWRFQSSYPKKDVSSKFVLPVSVKGKNVVIGGKVGTSTFAVPYRGGVDDVLIYDRALSPEEVARVR